MNYLSKWYTITFELYSKVIPMDFFIILWSISFGILVYRSYVKKANNKIYLAGYWLLCLMCIISLYIGYTCAFLISIEHIQENMISLKNCKFTLNFTMEYKFNFYKDFYKYTIMTTPKCMEIQEAFLSVIEQKDYVSLLQNPQITLDYIKKDIYNEVQTTIFWYENIDLLLQMYEDDLFYENIFIPIRNILLIFAIIYNGYHCFYWIMKSLYLQKARNMVEIILANYDIVFAMPIEEIPIYKELVALYIIETYPIALIMC